MSTRNIAEILIGLKKTSDEHARRMVEEPEYRARQEARDREEAERLADWKRQDTERMRQRKGVPRRVWPMLEDPTGTPALSAVNAFLLEGRKTFLVLAGGVGTGKTVAAALAIDRASSSGRFVKAIDLTRAGTYDEDFWDVLRMADLLAIDDLGTEPRDEKGWASANLEALLDQRYDDMKRTVLTTNLTADEFKARYCVGSGQRFLDRVREVGAFVAIPGESMRRAAAREAR